MKQSRFEVGDVCVVKTRDDLLAEFTRMSNITFGWNDEMDYLCGQVFTIKDKTYEPSHNAYRYYSEEGIEGKGFGAMSWAVSEDMLKPYNKCEIKAASKKEFDAFIRKVASV